MPFQFLNPIFLWGAVAAAVPVLIHLIRRRKTRTIRFAMLDFILQSQKKMARRFQLKEWLLLAIRTALILGLVGLGAHPVFSLSPDPGLPGLAGKGPSHLVVILDNSMSMSFVESGTTRLQAAREWAKERLGSLRGTQIAVLSTGPGEQGLPQFQDAPSAIATLDAVSPSHGEADILGAFRRAYGLFRSISGADKEILLLTDGANTGWDTFSVGNLKTVDPDVQIRLVRFGKKEGDPNAAILSLRLKEERVAKGVAATLMVRVKNFGLQALRDLVLELHAGGRKVDERVLRLDPGAEEDVTFESVSGETGEVPGTVRLRSDPLTEDNTHHFALFVREPPRVLAVDGDPKTSLLGSETFYLLNALDPAGVTEVPRFRVRWVTPEGLDREDLGDHDAIILANVSEVSASVRAALSEFVWGGGGLLFFLGDRVSPEGYNGDFGESDLLPARFLSVQTRGENAPEGVGEMTASHPALGAFEDLGLEAFSGVRVWRYFALEEREGARSLLRLEGGSPLLVERLLGKGRVMVFASTADRDWNDFSIQAPYLPFIQNLLLYLGCRDCPGGELPRALAEDLPVGEEKEIVLAPHLVGQEVTVEDPEGRREGFLASGKDQARVVYRATHQPGIYRARWVDGATTFSVHPPAQESDLTPIGAEELKEKFGRLPLEGLWRHELPENYNPWQRAQRDLTSAFLWVLFGLLAVEVVVANRS